MQTLKNKIVFITGASSGIGKASAEQFAAQGAHLILTARRIDRIKDLAETLQKQYGTKCLAIQLDVTDSKQVKKIVDELPEEWKAIDILLNNAGLALATDKMQEADINNWDKMIDTNVRGLLYVTHAILPGMVKRNSGHIINMGSTAGHGIYSTGNVYCATKHAVRAITQSLRSDLLGMNIRVSEIDPGATETEFSEVRWNDKQRAKAFYEDFTPLVAADIADAVLYCVTRPPHINIAELIVYPTAQVSPSLVYREGKQAKAMFD